MKKLSKNRLALIASLQLQDLSSNKAVDIWIKYETEIHASLKKHGKQYTLGNYKESYAFLRNYLLKLPTHPLSFCKVDRKGIPKTLWSLRPFIKGNRDAQRFSLTVARSYEQIRLDIDYSKLDSITDNMTQETETSVRNISKKFKRFLKKFTRKRK